MNITIEHVAAAIPVTVMRLDGDLDARSYEQLIDAGRAAISDGTRHILIDLRGVPFMGSSGLVAIHSIALMLGGEEPPDLDSGWEAHHEMSRSTETGMQDRLRLLGPVPAVRRVLERTGMTRFIEVYEDEAGALAAFG
jgi:anti-anti-sigma regulatory factor